jgi:hypothetical protein
MDVSALKPRSRLIQMGVDPELVEDFTDFREGYFGAPEVRVLAEAIKVFMADRLKAEPSVKERYETARAKRLGAKGKVVQLVPTGK